MENFSIEKPRIAKLTGLNYRPWSVQVQRLLIANKLWTTVNNTTKSPIAAPLTSADTELNAQASCLIMGYCSQAALQHILLLENAGDQWEALKTLYQPLGMAQLGTKLRAFTGYEPPKDATVSTIATQLSTLQAEIGDISSEERPTDTAKCAVFLRAIRALDPRF